VLNHPNVKTLARQAQQRISKSSPFRLQVRRSGIHRLGIFTAEPIPAGVKIIEYGGERISRRENRRRFLRILKDHKGAFNCLARLSSYWAIDGAVGGTGAELVNHSCEPNVGPRRERGHLWFVSLRRIRKGEELVADYDFPRSGSRIPCRCGAATCRGTINRP
jgi:uncharacterized protein